MYSVYIFGLAQCAAHAWSKTLLSLQIQNYVVSRPLDIMDKELNWDHQYNCVIKSKPTSCIKGYIWVIWGASGGCLDAWMLSEGFRMLSRVESVKTIKESLNGTVLLSCCFASKNLPFLPVWRGGVWGVLFVVWGILGFVKRVMVPKKMRTIIWCHIKQLSATATCPTKKNYARTKRRSNIWDKFFSDICSARQASIETSSHSLKFQKKFFSEPV